jgi:ABC-type multidrug transport system fused ATPase/permease subunit
LAFSVHQAVPRRNNLIAYYQLATCAGDIIVLVPLFWVASYFRVAMRDNFRAIRVRLARINAYAAESIAGMYIVQLFNREQRNYRRFDELNIDYLDQTVRSSISSSSVLSPSS